MKRDIINPQMKVGDLLDQYPELEQTLIDIAPTFSKLKNPELRRTIVRVATLQQAALTGDVPVQDVINRLREAAGPVAGTFAADADAPGSSQPESDASEPSWLSGATERVEFDARPMLQSGAHPLQAVFAKLHDLPADAALDLITPFHPAPLVDAVQAKGWRTHSRQDAPDRFVTSIGGA